MGQPKDKTKGKQVDPKASSPQKGEPDSPKPSKIGSGFGQENEPHPESGDKRAKEEGT